MAGGKTLKMSTVRVRVPLSILSGTDVPVAFLSSKEAERVQFPCTVLYLRTFTKEKQ